MASSLRKCQSSAEEWSKVVSMNENARKTELKGSAVMEAQSSGNLIENVLPRIDISKKIKVKIIKELNDDKWQVKKEALETLERIF